MTDNQAREWFEAAQSVARTNGVADIEMYLGAGESSLTRFANNAIHQNVSEESRLISIRVAIGQRTARATTNWPESIADTVLTAIALARASEPDPGLPALYAPQIRAQGVARWDEETATFSPQDRAEAVKGAIDRVQSAGHTAAGIFSTAHSTHILANSNGLFVRHNETGAVFSITATAADSSGWAKASAVSAGDLDPSQLAASAADKATRSASPRPMDPGRYRVLLEPPAVLDFVGQIFPDCSATAIDEERSFLTGRLGNQIFGKNITIRDDVRHPLQDGAPYDGEGVPRRELLLFDQGRPAQMPYSRGSAARLETTVPTGHGLPLPNEAGESVRNIVIEGGSSPREDLLRQLGTGILVTRLWYIREVDPFRKIMTGMTRDGTFWVEDGQIVHGIHNFRFNESIIDALQRVEAMSASERASGEETFDMVVPAMLIDGFTFSEVTLF